MEKAGNPIQVPWILVGSARVWRCPVLTPQFCCFPGVLTVPRASRGQAIDELTLFLPLPPIHSLVTETAYIKKKNGDHFVINVRRPDECLCKCFLPGVASTQGRVLQGGVSIRAGAPAVRPHPCPLQKQNFSVQLGYSFVQKL